MGRFRDLRLYCFEPVPRTYACLMRNLAESPQRTSHQITALNLGLAAADAQANIEFFPDSPANSTFQK